MSLQFQPKWYLITSNDINTNQTQCLVSFKRSLSVAPDSWVLGQPFLRAYYTIFDKDNNRIGVVPNVASDETQPHKSYNTLIIVVVVCGGTPLLFTIVGIIVCVVCRRIKKPKVE